MVSLTSMIAARIYIILYIFHIISWSKIVCFWFLIIIYSNINIKSITF